MFPLSRQCFGAGAATDTQSPAPSKKAPSTKAGCLSNIGVPVTNFFRKLGHNSQDTIKSTAPKSKIRNIDPLAKKTKLEGHLKQDYALLCLLKAYLPKELSDDSQQREKDFIKATVKTLQFLRKNGADSNIRCNRLSKLSAFILSSDNKNNSNILLSLALRDDATQALKELYTPEFLASRITGFDSHIDFDPSRHSDIDPVIDRDQYIDQYIDKVIGPKDRLDKRDTGLDHTLIRAKGENTWYESFKSYDLSHSRDREIMSETHNKLVSQRKVTHDDIKKNTAILGQGSFGKVVVARDIRSGNMVAMKKLENITEASKEFSKGRFLAFTLKYKPAKKSFVSPLGMAQTLGAVQNNSMQGIAKSYIFSELILEPTQKEKMSAGKKLRKTNPAKFKQHNFEQITLLCDLVKTLKNENIYHADLKPANIFGKKIGDLGDVNPLHNPFLNPKTGQRPVCTDAYTIPLQYIEGSTPGDTRGQVKENYNRFSLGVMLFESILDELPTRASNDENSPLNLSHMTWNSRRINTAGFSKEQISAWNKELNEPSYSSYDKAVLKLAIKLMSDENLQNNTLLDLDTALAEIATHLPQKQPLTKIRPSHSTTPRFMSTMMRHVPNKA